MINTYQPPGILTLSLFLQYYSFYIQSCTRAAPQQPPQVLKCSLCCFSSPAHKIQLEYSIKTPINRLSLEQNDFFQKHLYHSGESSEFLRKTLYFPSAFNGTAQKKMCLQTTYFKVFSLNFRVLPHSSLFVAAQDTSVRARQVLQGLQQGFQGLPKKYQTFQVHFTGYNTL